MRTADGGVRNGTGRASGGLTRFWKSVLRTPSSLLVVASLACSEAVAPTGALPPGIWGGDGVNLIIAPDTGRIELTCASGWLAVPVRLDAQGRFSVAGGYRFEGGPLGAPVPAQWTGRLAETAGGSQVTLLAVVSAPGQPSVTLGPFHLQEGRRVTTLLCA